MSTNSSTGNTPSVQISVLDRSVADYQALVDAAPANGLEAVLLSGAIDDKDATIDQSVTTTSPMTKRIIHL